MVFVLKNFVRHFAMKYSPTHGRKGLWSKKQNKSKIRPKRTISLQSSLFDPG